MAKVFVKTYGCASNKADSDIMRAILIKKGFEMSYEEDADIFIVNTCYVKLTTQNRVLSYLSSLKGKKVVVAGCMPDIAPDEIKKIDPYFVLVGTKHLDKIGEAIRIKKDFIGINILDKAKLEKTPSDNVYTVEICEGCNHNCTYCIVKKARGEINSFSIDAIVDEVKKAVGKGFSRINLTAQDTACYGFDECGKSKLAVLLSEINKLDGKFLVRVGMMNISNLMPVLDDVIDCYKSDKIMKFIHIPVQSGSDRVLKEMGRGYKTKDFVDVVNKFRKEIPEISIATDVIVGFPSETEDEFLETYNLIKKIKPEVVNISMYGNRYGTKASSMKQVDTQIVKERSGKISKLVKYNKRFQLN